MVCTVLIGDYGVLLGNSAFGLRRYLMMPFRRPSTEAEMAFDEAHGTTRSMVENTYGILKNCFQAMMNPLRVFGPKKSCDVITAMMIFHNIAIMHRDYFEPLPKGLDHQDNNPNGDNSNAAGCDKRNRIVTDYFSN